MGEPVRWLDEREQRAWRALRAMQVRVEGELARQLAEDSSLSYSDYAVLVTLTDQPDGQTRMYELAQTLGWEKSRLSHHVGRMCARGLVERVPCPSDRRGAIVVITALGRREIESAAPGHVAAVREVFLDHLSPEQLDALTQITADVLAHFDAADGPHGPSPQPRRRR